jgi:nanoRNase/pAp phosphatase (c-di-AMP/oligoRNAs hydrolase)
VREAPSDRPDIMTAFVDTCLDTLSSSAQQVQRKAKPRARKMLRALAGKKNILITTHAHPDPDAAASCMGLQRLLQQKLPDATVTIRFKGQHRSPRLMGFARTVGLDFQPWDEAALQSYDAIVLVDTQPTFSVSPLTADVRPTVVIDHHRGRATRGDVPVFDVRPEVGAASAIVFSYFMELNLTIDPALGSALLYGIEADVAGTAGNQSPLDTVAISGLVLVADIRKLWQMRYVSLPANYYAAFARAVQAAMRYDFALITHAGPVQQVEEAALIADGLLRCEGIDCALVVAEHEGRMILSLRTRPSLPSAGQMMQRLVKQIGEGGGHRTKAGGQIKLDPGHSAACDERLINILKRRLLRGLHIRSQRGVRLNAS